MTDASTPEVLAATPTASVAAAEFGSRSNPVPVITAAQYDAASSWTFTVGATDADAWPEIVATNEYNTAPLEGSAYVTVPVHIALVDSEKTVDGFDPWASFRVEYVTASGNTFDSCDILYPAPGGVGDLGTMFGGAQADFLGCATVPVADVPGGTWRISSLVGSSASAFFAGA